MGYEVKHIPKNNIVKDEPLVETVIGSTLFQSHPETESRNITVSTEVSSCYWLISWVFTMKLFFGICFILYYVGYSMHTESFM